MAAIFFLFVQVIVFACVSHWQCFFLPVFLFGSVSRYIPVCQLPVFIIANKSHCEQKKKAKKKKKKKTEKMDWAYVHV